MIDLHNFHIDKTSATPLYEQLRKVLQTAITSGELAAGTKLPTEAELCKLFNISRPVARQAYDLLIDGGYVERMRGRGTFVRIPDNRGIFLNKQLSFASEMKVLGLEHRTVLLRAEWLGYEPNIFGSLALTRDQRCYHIVRMRYVNDKPFVLVENFIPESVFPGIDQYDFAERSLYEVYESVYGERAVRSHRHIIARVANTEFASLFGVHRGSPVFLIENLVFDQHGRPIDFSKEYLDGLTQKIEFEVVNQ